jgi:hypothetical protein
VISRVLILIVSTLLAGCAPRVIKLNYPASWSTLDTNSSPRWVVAFPEELAPSLKPLMELRSRQGYEVVSFPNTNVASLERKVADLQLGRRKQDCLLLVGTTTVLPGANGRHHRMAGVRSDSRFGMKENDTTPLFPVGRLPVNSRAKTDLLIKKILAFESTLAIRSTNKNGVLLVGNPASGSKRVKAADVLVSSLSGSLLRKVDQTWETSGAADVPGHPFASRPEEFPIRFRRELDQPYDIAGYFGHSSSSMLCRSDGGTRTIAGLIRHSFGKGSWNRLSASNQRGLFVSCGCYCLAKDDAVGYQSVLSNGGPVAFIGATGESYSAIGYLASKGLVGLMTEHPPKTVGEWFLGIQTAIATESVSRPLFFAFDRFDGSKGELSLPEQRKEHLEMWMLVGDPATRVF